MLLKNKKIAIIGAGPVGLTMAKLLQRKGVEVTVYERDKDAQTRIWGGTLDLHQGSGQDALKKAGLLETYYAMSIPMGRTIVDQHGKVLFSQESAIEEQYENPEINRNDLRKLLLDSLADNTVVWDSKLTGLEEQNGKWLLYFENEQDQMADVVIGANGGMSVLRKHITDAEVEYTGTFIIQGDVPMAKRDCRKFYELCDGKILMTSYKGNLLVANPKNNDVLSYSIIFKIPEDWKNKNELNFQDTTGIIEFLSGRFSERDECYHELFRATSFFAGLPTRKISVEKPWKTNRPLPVTLIGDAAHIMPPFAGQGVNIGLVDALILSENLTEGNFETIEEAISDYEQKMVVYAAEAQLDTRNNELEMRNPEFSFQNMMR